MGSYEEHQKLIERTKLLCTKELPRLRLFDRHVGLFYKKRVSGNIIDYTPIAINKPGMADLDGKYFTPYGFIVNLEFEAKTGQAKQSSDQKIWQNFIENNGQNVGAYILFRTEFELVEKIKKYLSERNLL